MPDPLTPAEFAGLKIVQGNGHTDVYLGNYWVQFPPLDADRIDGLREMLARAGWGGAKFAGPPPIWSAAAFAEALRALVAEAEDAGLELANKGDRP